MKKILCILLFTISWVLPSQGTYRTEVTYKVNYDFDMPYSYTAKLIFNNVNAYYFEVKANTPKVEEGTKLIEEKPNIKGSYGYNTNLVTDFIFYKTLIGEQTFLQKEKITRIPWKIDADSEGEILGYKCKKATGLFRGREYVVWFTQEIPVKFGPWKLNGLPGLILEVKDTLGEVEFTVEKIEFLKEEKKFEFDFPKEKNDYPVITLKDYVKKLNDDVKNKIKLIMAKLPKGTKVISKSEIKEYRGAELKYEWEK